MSKQAAVRAASKSGSLQWVFDELHPVLMRFAPPYVAKSGEKKDKPELHLLVPKPVTLTGHYGATPKQIGLAAIILQKNYVALHFVPLYLNPKLEKQLSPRLMKLLKGKACFQVKECDAELKRDVEVALRVGTEYFRQRDWM